MPLRLFIISVVVFFVAKAFAKDVVVFDVRRQVSLNPDKRPPQDFFINAGSEIGLKEGMLVVVNRRQTLYDSYQNKSVGDLVVPVAQIRIIHVQNSISVARLEKMVDRRYLPSLDFDAVMVGDRLDMETAKMAPQKTAQLEADALAPATSPAAALQPATIVEVLKADGPAPAAAPTTPATKTAAAGSAEFSSTGAASSVTVPTPAL